MKQILAPCDRCGGTGSVKTDPGLGLFGPSTCDKCGGTGKIIRLVSDDAQGAQPVTVQPDPNAKPTWVQMVIAICTTIAAISGTVSLVVSSYTNSKVSDVHDHQLQNSAQIQGVETEVKAARQEVRQIAKDMPPQ